MGINQRWFVWIILLLCVAAIPVGLMSRSDRGDASDSGDDGSDFLSSRMKHKDRIQVIRLTGMIIDKGDGGLLSKAGTSTVCIKQLRKAAKDEHIKGVLLRINSPGGTVPTSQEITQAVTVLRDAGKPVYVSMSDLAASGGYYVASASDKIFAEPGTITGSIGVIMSLMNFKTLGDKVGVNSVVIKSGPFKDMASPWRAMTEGEQKVLQALIDDSYDQFVNAIAKGRRMKVDDVKKIADGRIYSGRQAKKIGLVDELGGYDDALDALQETCKKKYALKDKLPVDDKSSESLIASLLESSAGSNLFSTSSSHLNAGLLDDPEATLSQLLLSKFHKQPLWMMQ